MRLPPAAAVRIRVMETGAAMSDEATTRWVRLERDADDTIPVDLYSRPYERIELAAPAPRAAPPRRLPGSVVAAILVAAFSCGFGLVVLLA